MTDETDAMTALKERVRARLVGSGSVGMEPINAAMDEVAKAGFELKGSGRENAGKLWGAVAARNEEFEVKLEMGGQTIRLKVSEDLMHLGEYLATRTVSHSGGWLWPHSIVDEHENKHFFSVQGVVQWLTEMVAPCVLEAEEPAEEMSV